MLPEFIYYRPNTLPNALELLSKEPDAILMTGGTDLMVQLRLKIEMERSVIDLSGIEELRGIREFDETIQIGAGVTFREIMDSKLLRKYLPTFVEASSSVGSPQIRNVGTIGGNVMTASPGGDGLNSLYPLDTTVILRNLDGIREMKIVDFITGPKKTAREKTEILTGFKIPKKTWDYAAFHKLGRRKALAISVLSVNVLMDFDKDGIVSCAAVSLGSVAPTPRRIPDAEKLLVGAKVWDEKLEQAFVEAVRSGISPISDVRASGEYRRHAAGIYSARLAKQGFEWKGAR